MRISDWSSDVCSSDLLSSFIAGQFCTTQLAEFGAEVIKVELPVIGDALRRFGTPPECGDSLPWQSEARNKKAVPAELPKPEGAAVRQELVRSSQARHVGEERVSTCRNGVEQDQ